MDQLISYLPFIVPLYLIQLILMIVALVHLIKNKKVKFFTFPIWIMIILCINLLGPILYLTVGKADE